MKGHRRRIACSWNVPDDVRYRRPVRVIRRFTVRPVLPQPLAPLSELAANLRWAWHPPTQQLFASIDRERWDNSGHDPGRLLGAVPKSRLEELALDEGFLGRLGELSADLEQYLTGDRWYQRLGPEAPRQVAYFSPEFGITSVLPQYSGGLGILAGDHLKAASDLGVPLVGVGLLYRHGYFRQTLSRDGWQQEQYPVLDPDGLPLSLLRGPDGSVARVRLGMPDDRSLSAQIWVAHVGRVELLLLDSDIEDNTAEMRSVTDRLYGGNTEHRLRQEMLLGIGGIRALRTFSQITGAVEPEVYHTNEGHAGFLGLERIRELTEQPEDSISFDAALEVSRAGTVFTTHTPVPAGIDRFPCELVEQYFGGDNACPGVPLDRILALGAEDYPGGDPAVFNMAVMGFRLAQRANGVSALHGDVSRHMFGGMWASFDPDDVPITSITNGVHAPTWVAPEIYELARAHGVRPGPDPDADPPEQVFGAVDKVSAADIWATKRALRGRLVADARARLRRSWQKRGAATGQLAWIDSALDPDVLTIGFARRVPSYKRLTLMLRDPERLKAILLHPVHPVQLVIAGKAHPADEGGKKLIQEIVQFADDPQVRHRIVFLPNYDIAMAQPLYPGCDVWLNNPLRPYEACGTSGMKAALNGGLNLSILDGWWDEWYDGDNGWSIASADGVDDPDRRDDIESAALYDLIENEVAPKFYDTDGDGIPAGWIEMVRHALKSLGPKVLADRMVRAYVEGLYTPSALSSRALNDDHVEARALADWKARMRSEWPSVHVDHVEPSGVSDVPQIGDTLGLRAFVSLGSIPPDDVDVQVVYGSIGHDDNLDERLTNSLQLAETYEAGRHRYEGTVPLEMAGLFGYTVRVLPRNEHLASPAELGLVALA
jgi:starch phosphorylase